MYGKGWPRKTLFAITGASQIKSRIHVFNNRSFKKKNIKNIIYLKDMSIAFVWLIRIVTSSAKLCLMEEQISAVSDQGIRYLMRMHIYSEYFCRSLCSFNHKQSIL